MAAEVDGRRLRRDQNYLISVVGGKLQKSDRQHRGLLTLGTFETVLRELGLAKDSPEATLVLSLCKVTADGYVHYKGLLHALAPATPRARQTCAKAAIFPEHAEAPPPISTGDERTGELRRLYVRWERSHLSNEELKRALHELGYKISDSLERLLTTAGPSRAMPFAKLLQALNVEENDGRRARAGAPRELSPADSTTCLGSDSGHVACSERSSASDGDGAGAALRQTLCEFIDGKVSSVAFRSRLARHGIVMSNELDRLITRHEQHGSARFQDLLRLIQSQVGGLATCTPSAARPERRPFASGGDWEAARGSLDCAASVTSTRSECGYPTRPPWATIATLDQDEQASSRGPTRARSSAANPCDSGDVIGWRGCTEALAPPKARQQEVLHDIFNQAVAQDLESVDGEVRFGKRFYARAPSAAQSAPFGRDVHFGPFPSGGLADVQSWRRRGSMPAPFGTDADNVHVRPEDAGTDEYRGVHPRMQH